MLAYVAYLNLSVFTKRQMVNSKQAMKMYEEDDFNEN